MASLKNSLQLLLEGKADARVVDDKSKEKAYPTPKELRKAELL